MTFPQAYQLFDYWKSSPPEHEMLAMFARIYTTWQPGDEKRLNPEQAHRASLEARWKSGAMNVKQMFSAMGGVMSVNGSISGPQHKGADLPGIGPFPGTLH